MISTAHGPDPCAGLDTLLEGYRGVTFRQHIGEAFPGFRWYRYNGVVVAVLQQLVDGTLLLPDGSRADKVFVAMRPQTGKSTILHGFASWVARKYPGICQGASMHNHDMSIRFSQMVRKFYAAAGGSFDTKAIHNWHTSTGSEFWACSKGTSPTGRPASVLYSDDLLSGHLESANARVARDDIEWLTSEFLQRLSPLHHEGLGRTLQICIGTRWGLSDVQAYLLSLGGWYCVILPTLYQPDEWPIGVPVGPFPVADMEQPDTPWEAPNCTIHSDWRGPGEGLEPSVEALTAEAFHARRRRNGGILSEGRVSAIEQGNPQPLAGGGIIRSLWIEKRKEDLSESSYVRNSRAWDIGTTEGGGTGTASTKIGRLHDSKEIIRNGCRAWKGPKGVNQLMAAFMLADGPRTHVVLPLPKATGKMEVYGYQQYLQRVAGWAGVMCSPIRPADVGTTKPPAERQDGDEPKSPKWWRLAAGADSFAEMAEPVKWNEETLEVEIYGPISIVMAPWHPDLRKIIPGFADRAKLHPELLEIELLLLAATGQLPEDECARLHVDSENQAVGLLLDLNEISAAGGGQWDRPDSCADAHRHVMRPLLEMGAG